MVTRGKEPGKGGRGRYARMGALESLPGRGGGASRAWEPSPVTRRQNRDRGLGALCNVVTVLAVALWGVSCGGSSESTATLTGKSPSEASQEAATAICNRNAKCGIVDISCTGGTDAATQCSASIDHPDAKTCVAQEQPSLEKLLSCAALTASEVETIQQCVDALVAQPCVTQAEAESLALTAQEGMALPPNLPPAVCASLEQPIAGCQ